MRRALKNLYRQSGLGVDPSKNFPSWSGSVWRASEERLQRLKAAPCSLNECVTVIDAVSEECCAVLDSANCAMATHGQDKVRQVAEETYLDLYKRIQEINVDPDLYKKLKTAYEQEAKSPSTDRELERVARKLIQEFEWEGAAHLAHRYQRDKVNQAQNAIRYLQAKGSGEEAALMAGQARPPIAFRQQRYSNTYQTYSSLIRACSSPEEAKVLFDQYYQGDDTVKALAQTREELRRRRMELASMLGFDSFAHFAVNKNMARKPAIAEAFLVSLVDELDPLIRTFAKGAQVHEMPLILSNLASKSGGISPRLQRFFTMRRCLEGLKKVANHVFGVDVIESDLNFTASETWCEDPLCMEWTLVDEGSQVKGVLLLDVFSRENKATSPALYQIQTRRAGRESDVSVAMLSCSFPRTGRMDSVIGHLGFRTLMHEFGHALHALLSETRFQHLSGTRCEIDFTEAPSLLLERMAWHPEIIRLLDERGSELFEDDLKSLESFRSGGFAAYEQYEQAILGVYDLRVNGTSTTGRTENEVFWEVQRDLSCVKGPAEPAAVRAEVFFPHTLGAYAGSFYTYSWSNAIVAQIWFNLFQGNPLNADAGRSFKKALLATGGAEEPSEVMKTLVKTGSVDSSFLVKDLHK